jgi:hypothetical protein
MFGDPLFLFKKFIYQNLIERAGNLGLTEDAFSSDPDKPNDRRVFYISRALYEDDALASVHKGIVIQDAITKFSLDEPKGY